MTHSNRTRVWFLIAILHLIYLPVNLLAEDPPNSDPKKTDNTQDGKKEAVSKVSQDKGVQKSLSSILGDSKTSDPETQKLLGLVQKEFEQLKGDKGATEALKTRLQGLAGDTGDVDPKLVQELLRKELKDRQASRERERKVAEEERKKRSAGKAGQGQGRGKGAGKSGKGGGNQDGDPTGSKGKGRVQVVGQGGQGPGNVQQIPPQQQQVAQQPQQPQQQQQQQEEEEEEEEQQEQQEQQAGAGAGGGGEGGGMAKEPKAAEIDIKPQEFTAGEGLKEAPKGLELTAELFKSGDNDSIKETLAALRSSPPPSSNLGQSSLAFYQQLLQSQPPISVGGGGGGVGRGGLTLVRNSGNRFQGRILNFGGRAVSNAFYKAIKRSPRAFIKKARASRIARTRSAKRLIQANKRTPRFASSPKTNRYYLGRAQIQGSTRGRRFRRQNAFSDAVSKKSSMELSAKSKAAGYPRQFPSSRNSKHRKKAAR